ncbi:MAG: helix-turn-helix transcriptional regulator [Planctomycetota bacterium]
MLQQTLQRLIDQKHTSAKEMGELAGVSPSTVYRWISGQSQPDYESIRLLLRHLPSRASQKALLHAFTAGTDWHCTMMEVELDVNHDGHVDADDALDASCQAVKSSTDSLLAIRAASRGKALTSDETIELISMLGTVVRQCTITQRILVDLAERRKKAKTPNLKIAE